MDDQERTARHDPSQDVSNARDDCFFGSDQCVLFEVFAADSINAMWPQKLPGSCLFWSMNPFPLIIFVHRNTDPIDSSPKLTKNHSHSLARQQDADRRLRIAKSARNLSVLSMCTTV